MKAIIVNIGDELLIGQTVNTNSAWLGEQISALGIKILSHITIPDELKTITNTLEKASKNADLIVITGGLGPTKDDITKLALCEYFNTELTLDNKTKQELDKFYTERGKALTETNLQQAFIPNKAQSLSNSVGAAPGTYYSQNNILYFSLPGVPIEMKAIFSEQVLPIIVQKLTNQQQKTSDTLWASKTIFTSGIPESTLSDKLEILEEKIKIVNTKIAYLPSTFGVKLRIDVNGENNQEIENTLTNTYNEILQLIPENVISEDMDVLEAVASLLSEKGLTVATAESCTGGMLGSLFTSLSGSSKYYTGGVVSYQNEVKESVLHVETNTLQEFGAVSKQTAEEMAIGVRQLLKSNFAISITGIAGPNGGSIHKPVGTVFIGISGEIKGKKFLEANKYIFGKNRTLNRERACSYALFDLYKILKSL